MEGADGSSSHARSDADAPSALAGAWRRTNRGGAGGPPNIADFDGDGVPDIGTAGGNNYVVVQYDGVQLTQLWQADTKDGSSQRTGSSVFDFDGDGRSEVIYGDEWYLRIYPGVEPDCTLEPPGPGCDGETSEAEMRRCVAEAAGKGVVKGVVGLASVLRLAAPLSASLKPSRVSRAGSWTTATRWRKSVRPGIAPHQPGAARQNIFTVWTFPPSCTRARL